jgi:hypothetical protein
LVRVQHRFNDSSYIFLLTPPEAEDHLQRCDLMMAERRRERARRSQLSGGGGQMGTKSPENAPKCPPTSESTSDSTSDKNGLTIVRPTQNSDSREGKIKGLSEEERLGRKIIQTDGGPQYEVVPGWRRARRSG